MNPNKVLLNNVTTNNLLYTLRRVTNNLRQTAQDYATSHSTYVKVIVFSVRFFLSSLFHLVL